MPRKLRIIFPGAVYHITVRGNNQQKIFRKIADYFKLLRILREAKKQFGFRLYAFVFMPNHFHLLICVGEKFSISEIMKRVNQTYTQYFNKKYKCSGHLFQGRFFCSLINNEAYFWEVSRYIHLNPVRAKLCLRPVDYQWSSYQFYCQEIINDDLIDREELLEKYFPVKNLLLNEKLVEYQKFVEEGMFLKDDDYNKLANTLKIVD
ncbi:MAG: transposase [candidate division WOR-3 bacterium]